MKIKLKSNGQIINPPLRVAQRYIRLGRAVVYVEPIVEPVDEAIIFREPEPVEVIEEVIEADLEFDGIEELSLKPKVKVKKKEKTKEPEKESEEYFGSPASEG
jgi:hypothetical protein